MSYLHHQELPRQRTFGTELSNLAQPDSFQDFKRKQSLQIGRRRREMMEEERGDPQTVNEYASEIFCYLLDKEAFEGSINEYMPNQKDINEKMRAILIDWLVDVHLKFKLRPETLYLTVNIVDRYLSKNQVLRQKLQLVGVTAMLIACKYEEIYAPEVKDFVYVTDNAYNREEVLQMEGLILSSLDFDLTYTSPLKYLEKVASIANLNEKNKFLAKYLLELSLVEMKMIKYLPCNLACSAVYLVNKISRNEGWNFELENFSRMQESELRKCAKDLCVLLQNCEKTNLQAIRNKYSQAKFMEVGKIKLEKN